MSDATTQIDETVKANDVVLYMKGTKEMPQCGFSPCGRCLIIWVLTTRTLMFWPTKTSVRGSGLFRLANNPTAIR